MPRLLIQEIFDCISPKTGEMICDPACCTGGFLFPAHNTVSKQYKTSRDQLKHPKKQALRGWEQVKSTARLEAMNLMLHGIGSETSVPIVVSDALVANSGQLHLVVLTNPSL